MVEPVSPFASTFETAHGFHAPHHRRQRPPDMDATLDESRVPSRAEKLQRRESRLGLRNMFTRSTKNLKELREKERERETEKDAEKDAETEMDPYPPPHLVTSPAANSRDKEKHPAKRTSLAAELGHWPSALHPARAETPLPHLPAEMAAQSSSPALPQQVKTGAKAAVVRRQKSGTLPSLPSRPLKSATTPWQPPPLFQAYPQAIKYMHLRASTISGDSILRLSEKNEKKGASSLRDDLNQLSPGVPPAPDDQPADKERAKKKHNLHHHQRNQSSTVGRLDWTTKIYVLVPSGYLLQYAGAGPFDRLPEKILSLTKDSAAFASDVIPGKHWVLHVASQMDPDAASGHDAPPATTTPSRSIFSLSRLRGADRRHASNYLMVFEDADDMEAWIVVLRKEIESLGGKKKLPETGRPKAEHAHSHSVDHGAVRSKTTTTSYRALGLRDHPERISRLLPQNLPWNSPPSLAQHEFERPRSYERCERSDRALDPDRSPSDQAADAMSTTNSFVSHDGRQLESLRESGNRLSLISSGQRTVITSPGSSPSCSPTREAFALHLLDEPRTPVKDIFPPPVHLPLPNPKPSDEVRMRPNAAEIHDRRQSLRAAASSSNNNNLLLGEMALVVANGTPQSPVIPFPDLPLPPCTMSPPHQTTPNFSVPHSLGRRYSFAKTPPIEQGAFPTCSASPAQEPAERLRKHTTRRPPPPPLPLHPRSTPTTVPDHAPPRPLGVARRQQTMPQHHLPTPDAISLRRQPSIDSRNQTVSPFLPPSTMRPDSRASAGSENPHTAPRRYASMHTLRTCSPPSSTQQSLLPPFDMNPPEARLPAVPPIPSSSSSSPSPTSSTPSLPAAWPKLAPPSPSLLQPPAPPCQLQPPQEIRRSRSSLGNRSEFHARSPYSPAPGHSPARTARCRKRASLQVMSSDGAINRPMMVMTADALGVMMPAGHVASMMSCHAQQPSQQPGQQPGPAPGLVNRRSMPQLTEGPPPAPPPTCALPPIPQKSALDV